MSISDLKIRLRDVPGIDRLTMRLASGSILLEWGGGYSATVGAAASDNEIESAIRDAVRLPPVSIIPDKPPAALAVTPTAIPAQPATVQAMSAPIAPAASPTAPGAHALNIAERLAEHSKKLDAILQQQAALLDTALGDQLATVQNTAAAVVAKITAQTDDYKAIMGQFSNLPGMGT